MSTPLFQEALIEAKKLREAATAEAKNAVLEAISPVIKQMIDKEINGIILEADEETQPQDAVSAAAPAPVSPTPSGNAGATGPITPTAPTEQAATTASATPPAAPVPAVSKASPPIDSPVAQSSDKTVTGTITTNPSTQQQELSIPIDQLFNKAKATEPAQAAPTQLEEIYSAVHKLLEDQQGMAMQAPPSSTPAMPVANPPVGMEQPQAPLPVPAMPAPVLGAPTSAPLPVPAMPAVGMPTPAMPVANPPVGMEQPQAPVMPALDMAMPAPSAPVAPVSAPMMEYKAYKVKLDNLENTVTKIRNKKTPFLLETCEKELYSLYSSLIGLRKNNAISPRIFSLNEERLELLHENLKLVHSYTKNTLLKGNNMKTTRKDSLKEFAKALFEGAEGFEKEAGEVTLPAKTDGVSEKNAHEKSGNPEHEKADSEKVKFSVKAKSEWPGKPAAESLLEQLEEEIQELMSEMDMEEGDMEEGDMEEGDMHGDHGHHGDDSKEEDEVILELSDNAVLAEARKARARLRALREQEEMHAEEEDEDAEEEGDDSLTLDIDLDGVDADDVDVNVNVNGKSVVGHEVEEDEDMMSMDSDEEEEEGEEEEGEEEGEEEEGEEEEETLQEVRRLVRRELNLLEGKKAKAKKAKAKKAAAEEKDEKEVVKEGMVLRNQLQETQLLTARSLYLNKLFVRDDLSGTQKRKIVEYLDSARTIAEAKEIYNRISRVLNTAKQNGLMNESVGGRRTLNESAEPKFDTSRWQILAGVKKS